MPNPAVFVALAFLAGACNAQSPCTAIRLDAPGRALDGVPVVNQGTAGLCQAAASVDIIEAQLFYSTKRRGVRNLSFVSLAINAQAKRGSGTMMDDISGVDILNAAREFQGCPATTIEGLVTSNYKNICREAQIMASAIKTGETTLYNSRTNQCQPPLLRGESTTLANNIESEIFKQVFSAPSADLMDLNKHINAACRPQAIDLTMLPAASFVSGSAFPEDRRRQELQMALDKVLDRAQPMPVGFRYCMKFLFDHQEENVNPATGRVSSKCRGNFHASSIIGRRQGAKSCEYLVKNSHGTSCAGYDKAWACEGGKVWVSAEALIRNTGSLFWLNEK